MKVPIVPKKRVDRLLERMRFAKAKSYIAQGLYLLDVGAGDGTFLHYLDGHVVSAIGIDPILRSSPLSMTDTNFFLDTFLMIICMAVRFPIRSIIGLRAESTISSSRLPVS